MRVPNKTASFSRCSFPRLLLRVIPHYFFLTPKSEDYALLMPAHRPHAFAIFVPNILCMFFHLVLSLPRASEETRGYLHGGAIIDFVGQKAPTSRLGLLLLDVVILAIQCLMLAAHQEREALRKLVSPGRQTVVEAAMAAASAVPVPVATAQDHDAEERGVLRDGLGTTAGTGDIELRSLSGNDTGGAEDTSETARSLPGTGLRQADADLLGFLRSGNAVLADFHILHTIRTVGNDYERAAAHLTQTIGYTATLAARAAERRARLEGQARRQP